MKKTWRSVLAAHAGSNLITQACGMQASLLGVSLEAYVIDNDMLGGILRTIRGIEASHDNLAADVIREVSVGEGHYLGHQQTLERMKADLYLPANRRSAEHRMTGRKMVHLICGRGRSFEPRRFSLSIFPAT